MKIVAINGSPHGKESNTNIMIEALFRGAREAGAETDNMFLAEKYIQHCRCCNSCWFISPGQCVIRDDMAEVLGRMAGVDVIILASPVYFENISGLLKVFMDRLTVTGNPHSRNGAKVKAGRETPAGPLPPKLVMVSNCGLPDRPVPVSSHSPLD